MATKKEQSKKKYGKWKKLDTSVLGTSAKGRQIREDEAAKKGKDVSSKEDKAEFGQYKEDTGGGEPMGQGTKYSKGGRGVWKDEYGQEPARAKGQPRTADGKFTYNSVNGKETKYESRGKTVNPLLTGGENGVKIDDVKEQFAGKSGDYWDKYKDIWYEKGSKAVMTKEDKKGYLSPKTTVSTNDIWDIAKHYNPETKQFSAKHGDKLSEAENWETKAGARSKEERAEHQKAAKEKSEGFMASKEGGIAKYEPNIDEAISELTPAPAPTPVAPAPSPTVPTSKPTPAPSPTVSAPVASEPTPAPSVPKETAGIKYSSDQVKKVKDWLNNKFGSTDPEKLTKLMNAIDKTSPDKLDGMIDKWVAAGIDFGFDKPKEEPTSEKEDGYEKKLKSKMGLTE